MKTQNTLGDRKTGLERKSVAKHGGSTEITGLMNYLRTTTTGCIFLIKVTKVSMPYEKNAYSLGELKYIDKPSEPIFIF